MAVTLPPLSRTLLSLTCALACVCVAAPMTPVAHAAGDDGIVETPAPGDGLTGVSIAPLRFPITTVDPGSTVHESVTIRNDTDATVTLHVTALALEGARDPGALVQPVSGTADDAARSVARWVELPDGLAVGRALAPGRQLTVPFTVTIPSDATPGMHAVAVAASQVVGADQDAGGSARVTASFEVASQLLLRVSGTARPAATITDVDSPRVLWNTRHATFAFTVEDTGSTELTLAGTLLLRAPLGGANRSFRLPSGEDPLLILPSGRRRLAVRWNDPPLVGWYRPRIVIDGDEDSGVRVQRTLAPVLVLPPLWLDLLLFAAVLVPVAYRRRSR